MLPILLYHSPMGTGPNPWKVAIILAELNLPYEIKWTGYADIKKEPYLSLNPNGRVPSIQDSNTGVAIFESGACIEYLLDTYDTSHILSYEDVQLKYLSKSWFFFQVSGQGPYFGQKTWFTHRHNEKVPSVIERYAFEAKRILGVIELGLKKQQEKGNEWLVGNKCTYADLSFVPWSNLLGSLFPEGESLDVENKYPLFCAWHKRLREREAVRKVEVQKKWAIENLDDTAVEVMQYIPRSAGGLKD